MTCTWFSVYVLTGHQPVTGPFTFAGLTPLYHPINSRLRGCFKTRSAGTLLALLTIATTWLAVDQHVVWVLPGIVFVLLPLVISQFGL